MTTVEKLFVQIFQRNDRIKQQVKQQTELYTQNLVSKLLIDGIDPPPWLWNPNQTSSDVPKVPNKEELISGIFLPRPQHPAVFYGSQYCPYNQSATHETAEILDRSSKAIDACSNSDSGARQAHAVAFEEDNAGCGTNAVPEVEVNVTSPKDEILDRSSKAIDACSNSVSGARQAHVVAFEEVNAGCGTNAVPEVEINVTSPMDEILDRSSQAIDACSNSDSGARPAHVVAFEEDNAGCGTNAVPEVEINVTSPKDETEPRISNLFAAQEQSLVRFQRSKSRQKALELRSSVKAKRKNLSQENTLAVSSAQDRLSFYGGRAVDLVNSLEDLSKPFVISRESCDNEHLNEGDSRAKKNEIVFAASYNRISSNSAAGATFSSNDLKADRLDFIPEKDCTEKVYDKEISSVDSTYNEPMDFCTSSATRHSFGACEERVADAGYETGIDTNTYCGQMSRSSSSQQPSCLNEVPNIKKLSHSSECVEGVLPKSVACLVQLLDKATASCDLADPFNGLAVERSCLKTISSNDGLPILSYNPSFSSNDQKSEYGESFSKKRRNHSTSVDEAVPCTGSKIAGCPKDKFVAVGGDEIIPNDLVKDLSVVCPLISESTKLQCLAAASFDCLRSVDPVKLDFDDTECCDIINRSCITLQETRQEISAKKALGNSSDSLASFHGHSLTAQEYTSLEGQQDFSKQGESHVGSLQSDLEDLRVDLKDSRISPIKYSALNIPPDYSEAHSQSSIPTHQANNETNAFQVSGTENYMGISFNEGSKHISELDIAKYHHTAEGKEGSTSVPHAIAVEHLEIDYYAGKDNSEKLQSVRRYSWPSSKKGKIEKEETSSLYSSPGFGIKTEPRSAIADNCDDDQIYQNLSCQLTKSMEDSLEFINNESRSHSVVLSEHENILSVTEIGGVSQGSLLGELGLAEGSFKERKNQKSDHEYEASVDTEALIDAERSINNGSHFVFGNLLSSKLAQSPDKWDLEMIEADQSMPVLEGFIIDPETSNEKVATPRNEITFDELKHPKTSIECSSIMGKVCKSASMQTPQILSIYKLEGIHTCHQSLPNGLFEYRPFYKTRYCHDLQNPFTSPVGNIWDKISLHGESSGKTRLSSNPEFACFPIEEDPDTGDEKEAISVPESVNTNVDTVVYCSEREPLADIHGAYSSFKQTDYKSNAKVRKHNIDRNTEKNILLGEKGTKISADSPNKRYSKLSSYGTNSRTKHRKLSVKEPKQKNIVSNVTSFIPPVQQKKDAALCKGKRDIKVKALGAAKAAKLQQEKRDEERKLRKEALKLDRARVEREELRLVELNKKKKEEERKKKDAEIAAKKRAREEGEKIERDMKRKRMEETRKQCLDEGKIVSGDKVDKAKQLPILVTPAIAKPEKMNNLKQKMTDTSYEISPYQCSDEEEDNEDMVADKKDIPSWARKSCVALVLPLQQEIEPSVVFPADSFCCTSEVVASRRQQ